MGIVDFEDIINRNVIKNVRKKKFSSFSRGVNVNMEIEVYKSRYFN